MKAPIHSQKHYVQFPIDEVGMGTAQSITLIHGVESTVANLANEVTEGSVVKAIYFELWLHNQGNLGESIVTLSKNPLNNTGPTFTNLANLYTYENKKNILFTHQGLTSNDGVSGPVVVHKGWERIPKSKQRFGLGDTLTINISNTSSNGLNRCGFATYKEYS